MARHAFGRLATAATLSNLGDGLRVVALPLLAASTTRDPVLVSGLVVASFLPWVLLGLPIGTLVDRGRPERFMLAANTARAVLLVLAVAGLATGSFSIWALYALAFLLGVGEAVYDNAAQSLVPLVVPDDRLERANGTLVAAERTGQDLAGPAAAGVLFGVSTLLPFGLNAVLLVVGVVLLAGIRTPVRAAGPASSAAPTGVLAQTAAGMRWLWGEAFVRRLILVGAALTFATMFWESTLVLLATGPLGLTASAYGFVLAFGAVGGVAGAVLTPMLVARFSRWWLQLSGLGLCAAVDVLLALWPGPVTVAVAWGGTGFGFALWNVVSVSARQRIVPAAILARVNSAARTLSMAAVPLGALAGGFAADHLGLEAPIRFSAVGLVLLLLGYAVLGRRDRHRLVPAPAAGPDAAAPAATV